MGFVRLLLALSVVAGHYDGGLTLFPGNIAVELFFMISGFYMSLILTEKYDPKTTDGILNFYTSRYLRLWPTFAVTALAAYAWWAFLFWYLGRAPTSSGSFQEISGNLFASALLALSNLSMIGQDLPNLFHIHPETGYVVLTFGATAGPMPDGTLWVAQLSGTHNPSLGQVWSIGAEIWFYLLAPFLIRLPTRALLLFAIASAGLRFFMEARGLGVYFLFPTQLMLFLAGSLAYRLGGMIHSRAAAVGCIVSLIVSAFLFGSIGGIDQRFKWILYAITAVTMNSLFTISKTNHTDRTIGELSYSIYITHALVFSIVVTLLKRSGLVAFAPGLSFIFVIAISFALYRYLEIPVNRFRERFSVRESRKLKIGRVRLETPATAS
jgi:peptidoglycan/LPS O-acetylase OafA/YrhL